MPPKVGFATNDFSRTYRENDRPALGGAAHYRLSIVADQLAAHGWQVVVGTPVASSDGGPLGVLPFERLDFARPASRDDCVWDCDIVVLQRCMWSDIIEAVDDARRAGQRIVNDVDDHFDGLPTTNRAFVTTHPKVVPEANVNTYRSVLARSDLLTVSTPFLAERLGRFGRPVVTVRNAIDLDRWRYAARTSRRIGWVGHTAHRASDLELLRGVIPQILDLYDGGRFVHAGADPAAPHLADAFGVARSKVVEVPMRPIGEYPTLFDELDVVTIPLSSAPFNDAKSAIKGMECAAAGVLFVASASPEYRWLHATTGIGRIARRSRDWLRHLRQIAAADAVEVAEETAANRAAVAALDIRVRWREWAAVYEQVAAGVERRSTMRR